MRVLYTRPTMHPILIQLGNLPIHTFGMMMGAGFLAGILYSLRQARKWGLDPEQIFNLSFWIMLSGVLGSRVNYIIVDLAQKGVRSDFYKAPLKLFAIWEGGLVWYGGFILATIVVIYYTRRYKMPVWRVCDVLAPGTFLGLAIGRFGCVSAGDDFGRKLPSEWASWGLTFTHERALVYPDSGPDSLIGVPLHPTQFYMALKSFFVALIAHLLLKYWKRFDGQALTIAFLLYPPLRAFIELYRGDFQRGYIPYTNQTLTTSQGIGIVVFAVGLLALWKFRDIGRPKFLRPASDAA